MSVLSLGVTFTLLVCGIQPQAERSNSPMIDASMAAALELQNIYAQVAEQVSPSVVCVTAYERVEPPAATDIPAVAPNSGAAATPPNAWDSAQRNPLPTFRRLATASGIVIDEGIILTCRHPLVTSGGTLVNVIDVETHNMQHFYAHVVGSEPTLNLAVLKLEVYPDGPQPTIKPITIGTHADMKPGHTAIAIADPFGALRTVTPGTCAAFPAQECYQADLHSTFIQAAMTIHPESYGGALATLDSKVIAIVVPVIDAMGQVQAQATPGITFALPIATVLTVGQAIREQQSHESPWMGFAVLSMNELKAKLNDAAKFAAMKRPTHGIYIEDVFNPSPATIADIRVGDFLLSINGERVSTVADFQRKLYLAGIGRTVTLEIERNGQTIKKSLTIEKRSPAANIHP